MVDVDLTSLASSDDLADRADPYPEVAADRADPEDAAEEPVVKREIQREADEVRVEVKLEQQALEEQASEEQAPLAQAWPWPLSFAWFRGLLSSARRWCETHRALCENTGRW